MINLSVMPSANYTGLRAMSVLEVYKNHLDFLN